jgi:hypothetical protein
MQQVDRKHRRSAKTPVTEGLEGNRRKAAPAAHWFLVQLIFDPEDGCKTFLRNQTTK